jgi:hypothetical protein
MTDSEALAEKGLSTSGGLCYEPGRHEDTDGYPEPDYGDVDWDAYPVEDWATYRSEPAPPPAPPWFRNPRLLFGLIAVAAAALVVATVLLITGKDSGEMPTARHLGTKTASDTPSERSSPRPSAEPSSSPATSPSPSAETSSPAAEDSPLPAAPQLPAESAAAPPPSPAGQSRSPAGPKINVTRNPMSFAPEKH